MELGFEFGVSQALGQDKRILHMYILLFLHVVGTSMDLHLMRIYYQQPRLHKVNMHQVCDAISTHFHNIGVGLNRNMSRSHHKQGIELH